jgi:hypothetical protein
LKRGGKGSGHVEAIAGELPSERRQSEKSHGTREMGFKVQDEGHKETARYVPTRLLAPPICSFCVRSGLTGALALLMKDIRKLLAIGGAR